MSILLILQKMPPKREREDEEANGRPANRARTAASGVARLDADPVLEISEKIFRYGSVQCLDGRVVSLEGYALNGLVPRLLTLCLIRKTLNKPLCSARLTAMTVIKKFMGHYNITCTDSAALLYAVLYQDLEILNWLMDVNCTRYVTDALGLAVKHGYLEVVQFFHSKNAGKWSEYVMNHFAGDGNLDAVK